MSHVSTAATALGKHRRKLHDKPREGTRIRAIYDRFMANKGQVIDYNVHVDGDTTLYRLQDTYGLDIRRIRNGHWILAGEWFGRVYVDYTQEENR